MRRDCTGNDQETQVHKETNGLREQPPTLFIFLLLLLFPSGNLTDGGHGLLHEGLNCKLVLRLSPDCAKNPLEDAVSVVAFHFISC